MAEEVSCIVIRMSNPTNSSFDLLEFMIDSYFHYIEFGFDVSKASPRFSIIFQLVDKVLGSDINVMS